MADAIVALNSMMRRWESAGVRLSWTDVTNPAQAVAAPDSALEAIAYNLAVRLAPEYGAELTPETQITATESFLDVWRSAIAPSSSSSSTVGAVIYRVVRVLSGQPGFRFPDTMSMDGAIMALNSMVQRWEANGTALGWWPVTAVTDTLPAPPEAVEAIVYNLAVKLRSEYGASLDPDTVQFAREGIAALERDRLTEMPLRLKARLPGAGRYDIYRDEWV